jgi:riboflavin-specific deaminase-like protein
MLLALARQGNPVADLTAGEIVLDGERGWAWSSGIRGAPAVEQLFDIYLPICTRPALTIAHLAQSLDGRIALVSGTSQFIAGRENLVHAHRLRALCDAVVVGRRTVEIDDPQLTTRLCPGTSPVRVVIDPDRKLRADHRIFQDGAAPTLLFTRASSSPHGHAEVVAIPSTASHLHVAAVVAELRRRGLQRIYVEGGGVTVSRFLEAGELERLHVTVAPTLFGSGAPSFVLRDIHDLAQARSLAWRTFAMGADVLFDCTVRA